MASITPNQGKVCEDCTEVFNRNRCLLTAIESRHHECLEALLKAGADVNFGCQSVPPVEVTERSQCKCDKMSTPTGTDSNRQYDQNYTPLMHAARHRRSDCAKILIQAGADVNRQNHNGDTALIEASCSNVLQYIETLTQAGADVNIQNYHGETTVMVASCSDALRCMEILIQAGADVNIRDRWGTTTLQSHFDCADCLLRAGADVNIRDFGGNTAVLIAVIKDNVKWTEKLIQLGADVNIPDTGGKTALVCAARLGHQKCLDLLIQAGAHLQITDSSGGTALHLLAGNFSNDKCIETLIKAGIDVNSKNQSGNTALTLAARWGPEKYLKLLLRSGAKLNNGPDLLSAASSGHPKNIKIVLEAGADVNVIDIESVEKYGKSALFSLSKPFLKGFPQRIKCLGILLAAGAKVKFDKLFWRGDAVADFLKRNNTWPYRLTILKLFCTTGEKFDRAKEKMRSLLNKFESELCLKHLCRNTIRKHLLHLDPHWNLFVRVPRLGLPAALCDYILYNLYMDDDDDDEHYRGLRDSISATGLATWPRPLRYLRQRRDLPSRTDS